MAVAARNFVTRLLGVGGETRSVLPPTSSGGSSTSLFANEHGMDGETDYSEDEVKYPIVGFKLVDGHALPTVQSAACNLHLPKNGVEEKVFGWYSKNEVHGDTGNE